MATTCFFDDGYHGSAGHDARKLRPANDGPEDDLWSTAAGEPRLQHPGAIVDDHGLVRQRIYGGGHVAGEGIARWLACCSPAYF